MAKTETYNYLVKRCDTESFGDLSQDEILACFTNLAAANRYAKAEMQKIYEEGVEEYDGDPIFTSKEDKKGFYRGKLVAESRMLYLEEPGYSVEVFVGSILVRSSYPEETDVEAENVGEEMAEEGAEGMMDTDNKSETAFEQNDHQIAADPEIQDPSDLAEGRSGCLSGLNFCTIGKQEPYSESLVKNLIKYYGGNVIDLKEAEEGSDIPEVAIFTILGEKEYAARHLLRVDGMEWVGPIMDQQQLFQMTWNTGGAEQRMRWASLKDEVLEVKTRILELKTKMKKNMEELNYECWVKPLV